jgi:mycothione reductase
MTSHPSAHVDVLIIGTGSGNSIPTPEYDDLTIGIVERGAFGGTCLNRGCIPSKMLVMPANRVAEAAEAADLGVHFAPPRVDWPSIRDRVFGRIDPIAEGGEQYRRSLPNTTVFTGDARFIGERTVRVTAPDGSTTDVSGDKVVLAAGASPSIPDIPGLADAPFHTSDTIMRVDEVPRHLLVIGGGFIAAELGHVFGSLGCDVTIVHRGARMLRHEDPDVSERFTREFARRATVHLHSEVVGVEHFGGTFRLVISPAPGHAGPDCPTDVTGDALLVTTGRRPNGAELEVQAAGVELDDAGYVITDDTLLTTAPNVWALGDVRNPLQLKHVANRESKVVSHNVIHPDDPIRIDERVVPHAVFSHPEVASVGETETALQARGQRYKVGVRAYGDTAYGWALEDRSSFAKVLVDAESGLILGAHVIGPQAATLVQQMAQAMTFGLPADRVAKEQLWAHPGLAEVLENALLDAVDG